MLNPRKSYMMMYLKNPFTPQLFPTDPHLKLCPIHDTRTDKWFGTNLRLAHSEAFRTGTGVNEAPFALWILAGSITHFGALQGARTHACLVVCIKFVVFATTADC